MSGTDFGTAGMTVMPAEASGQARAQRYRQEGFQRLMDAVPFRAVAREVAADRRAPAMAPGTTAASDFRAGPLGPASTRVVAAPVAVSGVMSASPATVSMMARAVGTAPSPSVPAGLALVTRAVVHASRAATPAPAPPQPGPPPASWRHLACHALLGEDGLDIRIKASTAETESWLRAVVRLREWLQTSTGLDLARCTINGQPFWSAHAHFASDFEENLHVR